MHSIQPNGCTCFRLRKLTRTMSRLYDHHLAQHGLKTTQYSVLSNASRQALPVAELAFVLAMERTTLTRNLKPLVESGWLLLAPGADARQRIVTITDAGQAKLREARSAWRAAQDEIESTLGAQTVQTLHQQLDAALITLSPIVEDMHHAEPD